MSKRLLLACYDVPGWGGAATCHYLLFERLQRDGWDVAYVNVVREDAVPFLQEHFGPGFGNPRSLDNVFTVTLADPVRRAQPRLGALISERSPDLLLCCGFLAAGFVKRAAPGLPLVFMTAGAWELQSLIESGAVKDYVAFERAAARGIHFNVPRGSREAEAVEAAEMVIVHSPLVRLAFAHLFPWAGRRVYAHDVFVADHCYAEAEAFAHLRRPFAERDIDVIFMASSWARPVKNYRMVEQLASYCEGLSVHVVGELERCGSGVIRHGLVTRREDVYALLGRSKALVCPSLLDAAPGVLFEASAMGCNVIASPNCGTWKLCHEALRAERCTQGAFLAAMQVAITRPFADKRAHFLGGYADLVETLSVL